MFNDNVEALVDPVNTLGAQGGLAGVFSRKFPVPCAIYKRQCEEGKVKVGQVLTVLDPDPPHQWLIFFPTKDDWRNPSEYRYIEEGLTSLVTFIRKKKIPSLSIPALGCGLGGLEWEIVQQMIMDAFTDLPEVTVRLYAPKA